MSANWEPLWLARGARRLWRLRFLRFCLVGGGATLIHAAVFLLACAASMSAFRANALAYAVSLLFNLTANFLWTFGERLRQPAALSRLVGFFLVTLAGFGLNSVIAVGVVDGLGARPVWAALLMATLTPVAVYTLNARFVFRRPAGSPVVHVDEQHHKAAGHEIPERPLQ